MTSVERIANFLKTEIAVARPRGTTGVKLLLAGFAANIGLILALVGAIASGNDGAVSVMRRFVFLPAHISFDGIIVGGFFRLRVEAERGINNFLFHKKGKRS